MSTRHLRGLSVYMWAVVLVTTPIVIVTAVEAVHFYSSGTSGQRLMIIVVFAVIIVIGEMRPIPVARGVDSGDEITISTAFGFGMLLVAPVFTAIAAQAVGLIVDCFVHRTERVKVAFNIAQYSLAYVAARAVYSLLADRPFTPVPDLGPPLLFPSLAAGVVFLIVNNLLVGIAIALHVRLRLVRVLAGDLKWQLGTSAPLIGLGPLAVQSMIWTPLSIVLLLMPIVALHHTGTMAMRREQEALRDNLTGLANRSMLTAASERALSDSVGITAMLLIDLDHFKEINDTLGHATGDEMLKAVAARLQTATGPDHLIARLGGDEFVVLARALDERATAVTLAERLCEAVRESVVLDGITLTVGCSIGIAFGAGQNETVSDLLRCADVALYEAKVSRGVVAVYDRDSDGHSATQLGLHADLRNAFDGADERDPATESQVWVAFQPQLDLRSGRVASLECLVRWRHPTLGDIGPDDMIPIAESTSLIDSVLLHVLDAGLDALREWDEAGHRLKLSVNLSARQLGDVSLPGTLAQCLARHDVGGDRLILEVTESRLMSNPELSERVIGDLRRLGIEISIDDFGTGYSSLAHLQRLSVHELKIDKSFTADLNKPSNFAIVRSTVDLGHNLGLRVVAEGVETLDTARQLARMGCDVLQGYLVGPPVAASDVAALIATVPLAMPLRDALRRDDASAIEVFAPTVPLQKAQ